MHTTVSDGKMTPEEVKEEYKKRGYQIVAFTDHEAMVPHNDLNDEGFMSITSVELATNSDDYHAGWPCVETCHMNLYSKVADKTTCAVFTMSRMWPDHAASYLSDEMKAIDFPREFTVESLNRVIAAAKEDGFLVSYNHPVWSLNRYPFYSGLKGVWGVEFYNTGCVRGGYPDTMQPIDDLLCLGERVFPLATDDAHAGKDTLRDCFGGWVMIRSDRLDYGEVMTALENGDFYASTGPDITEISLEDNKLTVKTSPAFSIEIMTERRHNYWRRAKDGEHISEAEFDLSEYISDTANKNENDIPSFFRVTVTDDKGNKAHSRAYFVDEL